MFEEGRMGVCLGGFMNDFYEADYSKEGFIEEVFLKEIFPEKFFLDFLGEFF